MKILCVINAVISQSLDCRPLFEVGLHAVLHGRPLINLVTKKRGTKWNYTVLG